jgi:hypothetical protein
MQAFTELNNMNHRELPSSNHQLFDQLQLRFSLLSSNQHSSDSAKVAFPSSKMCMDDSGLRVPNQAPAKLDAVNRPFSASPQKDWKMPAEEQSLGQLRRQLRTTM